MPENTEIQKMSDADYWRQSLENRQAIADSKAELQKMKQELQSRLSFVDNSLLLIISKNETQWQFW